MSPARLGAIRGSDPEIKRSASPTPRSLAAVMRRHRRRIRSAAAARHPRSAHVVGSGGSACVRSAAIHCSRLLVRRLCRPLFQATPNRCREPDASIGVWRPRSGALGRSDPLARAACRRRERDAVAGSTLGTSSTRRRGHPGRRRYLRHVPLGRSDCGASRLRSLIRRLRGGAAARAERLELPAGGRRDRHNRDRPSSADRLQGRPDWRWRTAWPKGGLCVPTCRGAVRMLIRHALRRQPAQRKRAVSRDARPARQR